MGDIGVSGKLNQTCNKVAVTINSYGDSVLGASEERNCLYRDISTLNRTSGNREEIEIDGLFWFDTFDWAKGDIILFDSEYYRVEKVIKARRRVADNALKFIKCEVTRYRQAVS